jgi:hypothetical protein
LNATAFGLPPIDFEFVDGVENAVFARIAAEGPISARVCFGAILFKLVLCGCRDEPSNHFEDNKEYVYRDMTCVPAPRQF